MPDEATQVEVRRSARRHSTVSARREGGRIVVQIPASMSSDDEREWVRRMVERIEKKAEYANVPRGDNELLETRARYLVQHFLEPHVGPVKFNSVRWVSNQRYRWGSCTPSAGRIRISNRLQTMPGWVIDYVLMHELVHLVEPHHTPRFKGLVAAYPYAERAWGFLKGWQAASDQPSSCDLDSFLSGSSESS